MNAGKVFDRIQSFGTPVHNRKSQQTNNGELPQPGKGLYGSPQRAVIIDGKGQTFLPHVPQVENTARVCVLSSRQYRKVKKENGLCFIGDMIVYMEK